MSQCIKQTALSHKRKRCSLCGQKLLVTGYQLLVTQFFSSGLIRVLVPPRRPFQWLA